MQEQINNLQRQIDDLKKSLENKDMPLEFREIIRNEVVKDAVNITLTNATENIGLTGDPETIVIPLLPTTFLIIKWKGSEYKIPVYNNYV